MRVFREKSQYVIEHPLMAAVLVGFFASGALIHLSIIKFLAAILIAVVTLRRGPRHGFGLVAVSALPALFAYLQWHTAALLIGDTLMLMAWVWFQASLLNWRHQWSVMLGGAALMSAAVVAGSYPYYLAHIMPTIDQAVRVALQARMSEANIPIALDHPVMTLILHLIPAGWAFLTAAIATFIVFLARVWQAALYNPGGARPEMHGIKMGWLPAVMYLVCVGLVVTGYPVIQNLAIVLAFPFVVSGLSIMHAVATKAPVVGNMILLVVLYLMIILVPQVMLLCLLITGLLDAFIDMRRVWRVKKT